MSELNGTGIDYPTLELGGVKYTLKVTRGVMIFRLSDAGINLAEINVHIKAVSAIIKVLHAMLLEQYTGTPEQLCELVLAEDKMKLAAQAVRDALGKVFPTSLTAAVTAGESKPLPN